MPKVKDIKADKLKVLVYGKSGSGKTMFAGTFPKPYVFDSDNGTLSLRNMGNDVEYDVYRDGDLARPTAINAIEKKVAELQKGNGIETIVVDSLTTIADLAMNRVLFMNGRAKAVPQQQDWLQQMNWIRNFVLTLLAMPKHVVVVAHEQVDKDENLGNLQALPMVTGKLAGKIGLYFDEVYNAQCISKGKEVEYRLLTRGTSIYTAKSRLGCFEMYEVPYYDKLMEKVNGVS